MIVLEPEAPPAPKKRKKGKSPTARSLEECKKRGWDADKVEQRLPRGFVTRDLFGFGDIVAMDDQPGSLIIQATSTAHGAERVTKIVTECRERARRWLERGNRIVVWSFAKQGPAGKQKRWTLKEYPITKDMVAE